MRNVYPEEKGAIVINGFNMEWTMRRSKGESAFGIRGSRIFELTIKKDGAVTGEYNRAWGRKIDNEDEESILCLNLLLDSYGKQIPKKRKEMGSKV